MSIIIEASDEELRSPFYEMNKKHADNWTMFREEYGTSIKGAVNAYYYRAEIEGVCDMGTFKIIGNRQIKNVSGPIPLRSPFDNSTTVEIEHPKSMNGMWKLRPKTIATTCASLMHHVKPATANPSMVIISSRKMDPLTYKVRDEFVSTLSPYSLSTITSNPEKLRISCFRLAYSVKELKALLGLLEDFLSKTL